MLNIVQCIPMPWREVSLEGKKLKFGVIWDDGLPTPNSMLALTHVSV